MRIELRKSAGPTCPSCGSFEHIAVAGNRIVHTIVQREFAARELAVARLFREHLSAVGAAQRLDLVQQLEWMLTSPTPAWWRFGKRLRRRLWRSTVEEAFEALDEFLDPDDPAVAFAALCERADREGWGSLVRT